MIEKLINKVYLSSPGPSTQRPWLLLPLVNIKAKITFNGVIDEETGRRNCIMYFQTTPGSVCSICVWCYRGEDTLPACIRHRHIGLSSGVMVWSTIGYTPRLHLVRIPGTLNSPCYISDVLKPEVPFIRGLRNAKFHQGNQKPHVAGIV
ncbi:hypothetical protein LAZ67_2006004 [Cordylochernes scorpioides]|uniref:Uncharacterized protein n=1 Tax=Cordylochernes scorpioides TaxID=51811 RepID=A0ABY6K881_9ARAC|nr:hypothetical protein LAZ67_2006004 [Cordylochernes scorpioides]